MHASQYNAHNDQVRYISEKNSGRNVVLQRGTNLEFFEIWMWMQGTLKEGT